MEKLEIPKTIGVNNGFLTSNGRLLLQIRTNNSWMGKALDKCYEGQLELNDGRFEVNDIMKDLTLPVLKKKAVQNAKEKLGIKMTVPDNPQMYFAPYKNKEKGINDWAIMFVIPPTCWQMSKKLLRDVVIVDVEGLNELASRPEGQGSLVSGWGKRQHRMSLCALGCSPDESDGFDAWTTLSSIKPDFSGTEYSNNAEEFLALLRLAAK